MTEFVGTVVVLALGVCLGMMLAWLVCCRLVETDWGKQMIKRMTSRLMDISIEWTDENMNNLQDKFERMVSRSFDEDEAKDK